MTNEQEQALRALYSQIPDDLLAVFDDYYKAQLEEALEEANEAAQASALGAADPNIVETDLVEELIFQTEGRDNPQGIGFVPSPGGKYDLIPPKHNPFDAAPAKTTRLHHAKDYPGADACSPCLACWPWRYHLCVCCLHRRHVASTKYVMAVPKRLHPARRHQGHAIATYHRIDRMVWNQEAAQRP